MCKPLLGTRFALLLILACSGCVNSSLQPCGDRLCDASAVCLVDHCATPEAVAACQGIAAGAVCKTTTIIRGHCIAGACESVTCGDGVTGVGEACDDGNFSSGDGCSADCQSNETCGNGIVDGVGGEQCDDGVVGLSQDGCSSTCTVELLQWQHVEPVARAASTLYFDSARQRMLQLRNDSEASFELFAQDESSWVRLHPFHMPPAAVAWSAQFDEHTARLELVMVRRDGAGAEHWAFDGVDWVQRAADPQLPLYVGLTYDRARRLLVGMTVENDQRYEYAFDGTRWLKTAIPMGPAVQYLPLLFDVAANELSIIERAPNSNSTLWTWNGTRWRSLPLSNAPQRADVIVYSVAENRYVALGRDFAGFVTVSVLVDSLWRDQTTGIASGNQFEAAVYNGKRQSIDALFQRNNNAGSADVVEIRYALDNVVAVADTNTPAIRYASVMTYDAARGVVVLFGGMNDFGLQGDTWEFDGTSWRLREGVGPSPRRSAVLTYDAAHQRVVLFGGAGNVPSAETWIFDGVSWTLLPIADSPPARSNAAFAYDDRRQRVVVFGGLGAASIVPLDTWEFDGAAWTRITTAQTPPYSSNSVMAYDPRRQRIILSTSSNDLDVETWEYDGANWAKIQTVQAPPLGAPLVADVRRKVVVAVTDREIWTYHGTTWTPQRTLTRGGALATAIAYDAMHGEIVRFGAVTPTFNPFWRASFAAATTTNETWKLSFSTLLDPPDRCDAAVDSDGDSLLGCGVGPTNEGADPDCAARCRPLCVAGEPCAPSLPHCGDGLCNPALENYRICPADCPPPP